MAKTKLPSLKIIVTGSVAIFILLILLLYFILNGYYFKEERKYGKQITLTTEQFKQIVNDDKFDYVDYWKNSNGLYDIDVDAQLIAECTIYDVGKKMTFAYRNNLSKMEGNCEGQAMLCSAVLNKAFEELGFKNCYAEPVLGQVYFYNINMHKTLVKIVSKKYKNFVINHCVVKVHYDNGEEKYYDPSILDGYMEIKKYR